MNRIARLLGLAASWSFSPLRENSKSGETMTVFKRDKPQSSVGAAINSARSNYPADPICRLGFADLKSHVYFRTVSLANFDDTNFHDDGSKKWNIRSTSNAAQRFSVFPLFKLLDGMTFI